MINQKNKRTIYERKYKKNEQLHKSLGAGDAIQEPGSQDSWGIVFFGFFGTLSAFLQHMDWFYWFYWYSCNVLEHIMQNAATVPIKPIKLIHMLQKR